MSDVVLASVQREDIKPRRRQCHRRGIGARPEEPGSNSVEREPSDLPSRLTELHVVRLGGDVLRNQFRRDLNRRGGKERHQVDRLVVADRSETVAHPNRSKAGGVGNHIGGGAAVGGRAEGIADAGGAAAGGASGAGDGAGEASWHPCRKDDGVAGRMGAKASVGTAVGAAQGGTPQALLDAVDTGGIVETNDRGADIGVLGGVYWQGSVCMIDERDPAGQEVVPFLVWD